MLCLIPADKRLVPTSTVIRVSSMPISNHVVLPPSRRCESSDVVIESRTPKKQHVDWTDGLLPTSTSLEYLEQL